MTNSGLVLKPSRSRNKGTGSLLNGDPEPQGIVVSPLTKLKKIVSSYLISIIIIKTEQKAAKPAFLGAFVRFFGNLMKLWLLIRNRGG